MEQRKVVVLGSEDIKGIKDLDNLVKNLKYVRDGYCVGELYHDKEFNGAAQ